MTFAFRIDIETCALGGMMGGGRLDLSDTTTHRDIQSERRRNLKCDSDSPPAEWSEQAGHNYGQTCASYSNNCISTIQLKFRLWFVSKEPDFYRDTSGDQGRRQHQVFD